MLFLSMPEAPREPLGTPGQGRSLARSPGGVSTPSVRTQSCLKSEVLTDTDIKISNPRAQKVFYFSLVSPCVYLNKRIQAATVRASGEKTDLGFRRLSS